MQPALAAGLPHSFGALLGRFSAPSAVQLAAIPAILSGRDVLICAPTASGKTEAFAAPCAEIAWAAGRAPYSGLILSPTRALANDLFRRLQTPIAAAGLSIGRHTGEHKDRVDGAAPTLAIATPEALDAMLARRPDSLRGVRIVVLDEVHILDGSARGDQLRLLLHRLEAVASARPQRVAVSATVDAPEAAAARYLDDAVVVTVGGRRAIAARLCAGREPVDLCAHLEQLASAGARKVLVFCNSRAAVEQVVAGLRGQTRFGDAVFAHHGSMARPERERSERALLQRPAAVCVATMTLEMGIDIGSVDAVLLRDVPASVSSLVQRIGRGNRRDAVQRVSCCADGPEERHQLRTMLRAAADGALLDAPYGLRPSVIVQQALVLAGAGAWVDATRLRAAAPAWFWQQLAPTGPDAILSAAAEHGLLERAGAERYVLTPASERRYDAGMLHSNIDAAQDIALIDRQTGAVLGHVDRAGLRDGCGQPVTVAGRQTTVVHARGDHALVDAAAGDMRPPIFRSRGAPGMSLALARRIVEAQGVAPATITVHTGSGQTTWQHGLGTVGALWLRWALNRAHGDGTVVDVTPLFVVLARQVDALPPADEAAFAMFSLLQAPALRRICALGPFHRALPADLQLRALQAAATLPQLRAFLATLALQMTPAPSAET